MEESEKMSKEEVAKIRKERLNAIPWKYLIITLVLCYLIVVVGLFFYKKLPDPFPQLIDFTTGTVVQSYKKCFFSICRWPLQLSIFELIYFLIIDFTKIKSKKEMRLVKVGYFIFPLLANSILASIILFSLGYVNYDCLIIISVGIWYLIAGNYCLKMKINFDNNFFSNPDVEFKWSRITSRFNLVIGIIFIAESFLNEKYKWPLFFGNLLLQFIIKIVYGLILNKKYAEKEETVKEK